MRPLHSWASCQCSSSRQERSPHLLAWTLFSLLSTADFMLDHPAGKMVAAITKVLRTPLLDGTHQGLLHQFQPSCGCASNSLLLKRNCASAANHVRYAALGPELHTVNSTSQ